MSGWGASYRYGEEKYYLPQVLAAGGLHNLDYRGMGDRTLLHLQNYTKREVGFYDQEVHRYRELSFAADLLTGVDGPGANMRATNSFALALGVTTKVFSTYNLTQAEHQLAYYKEIFKNVQVELAARGGEFKPLPGIHPDAYALNYNGLPRDDHYGTLLDTYTGRPIPYETHSQAVEAYFRDIADGS